MFDVGFAEVFLLGLIGLLVLGPERLPGVARTIGGFVRKARVSWASLRRTIQSELDEADISDPIKKASEEFKQIGKNLTDVPGFSPDDFEPVSSKKNKEPDDTPVKTDTPHSENGKPEK